MKHATRALILTLTLGFAASAFAVSAKDLPKKKQTELGLYLTATEAHKLIQDKGKQLLFIDVRTRAEVAFLGMPTVADANIPYMVTSDWAEWDDKKKTYKLSPNSNFLTAVEDLIKKKGLSKDATVILMCRSGSRSSKAANLMAKAGYKKVYSVVDGFEGDKAKDGPNKGQRVVNGWKNSQLPWSYKLEMAKMYREN